MIAFNPERGLSPFARKEKSPFYDFEHESLVDIEAGKISEHDRKVLEAAGPKLRSLVEDLQKGEGVRAIVYPGTGARLLRPFVDGLTEDRFGKEKPDRIFVKTYLEGSDSEEVEGLKFLGERVAEIVGERTDGKYLIVDDYVSHHLSTTKVMREAFKKAGVPEDNLIFFAIMGEKAIMGGADDLSGKELEGKVKEGYKVNEAVGDLILPDDYYLKHGVEIGVIDPRISRGLDFNNDVVLKGTFKRSSAKYEEVIKPDHMIDKQTNKTLVDRKLRDPAGKKSPETILAERKKNIRKNLYHFGKMIAEQRSGSL